MLSVYYLSGVEAGYFLSVAYSSVIDYAELIVSISTSPNNINLIFVKSFACLSGHLSKWNYSYISMFAIKNTIFLLI